jgi:hypothetical protein
MIKLFKFSKITQVLILFAFFLPFFKDGCGPSIEEKAKIEQAKEASMTTLDSAKQASGSLTSNNTYSQDVKQDGDTAAVNVETPGKNLTDKLIAKNSFYKIILRPYDGYSGIGYIIDYAAATIAYGGTILAFLFLLVALVMKLINKPIYFGPIFTFDLLAFVSLLLTHAEEYYWGYWICLVLITIVLLMDAILFIGHRRQKK